MERRTFSGAVVATLLANSISNSSMTIDVIDGSTFPSPSSESPMVISVDRSTEDEEKILVSTKTSNSFTVMERGYDGTVAKSHSAGAAVDHVLDATTMQDMNKIVYDTEIINWMGI